MMSSRVPNCVLTEEVIIEAPPKPIFMLLSNFDFRSWIDHGEDWIVQKVEVVGHPKKGLGTVTRWKGEFGATVWERLFTIIEWRENEVITFESEAHDLIIRHLLSPINPKQTRLTVTKEFYCSISNESEEREHLATLVDNTRALMSRKK